MRPRLEPAPSRRHAGGNRGAVAVRLALALVLGLQVMGVVGPLSAATLRVEAGSGMTAVLREDQRISLEAVPLQGEGLLAFARRLCGDEKAAAKIAEANGGARSLVAGIRYRVPYELLRPELQLKVARVLFAHDQAQPGGWRHTARGAGELQRESLWHVAEWFTGKGENFRLIRAENDLVEDEIPRGQTVTIPAELLRPAFRSALPPPPPRPPMPASAPASASSVRAAGSDSPPYPLETGRDAKGEYAIYRLKPGEALYSSVVVRFTGRVLASDVNALASEIAERSGIRDVTDIPVGYEVKIPFDLLLPEYLPEGNPRRREYEESLRASAAYSNKVRTLDLEGITVVLDPGHGGKDAGATMDGVWESLYTYDVALRIRRLLEASTAARVVLTTRDGDHFEIPDRDVLPYSRGHAVLTSPPYPIDDPRVGVNLRWYLANSVYRHTVRQGGDPEKVVFVSIHANSLHPSVRGMMAYIPGARLSAGSFRRAGPVYAARKEYREAPRVSFSRRDLVRSEGLSRELAENLVAAFRKEGLPVHPFKPIREKVIRGRSEWVPAVLRYNAVPAKVLVEMCNLANDRDRHLLQTRAYRHRVAQAVVDALLSYYGRDGESDVQVAATAR